MLSVIREQAERKLLVLASCNLDVEAMITETHHATEDILFDKMVEHFLRVAAHPFAYFTLRYVSTLDPKILVTDTYLGDVSILIAKHIQIYDCTRCIWVCFIQNLLWSPEDAGSCTSAIDATKSWALPRRLHPSPPELDSGLFARCSSRRHSGYRCLQVLHSPLVTPRFALSENLVLRSRDYSQ
jgi:hypothetical protein